MQICQQFYYELCLKQFEGALSRRKVCGACAVFFSVACICVSSGSGSVEGKSTSSNKRSSKIIIGSGAVLVTDDDEMGRPC